MSESEATILVVEDDNSIRRAVCRMLRAQGYDVIEATDGEDAIVAAGEFGGPIHLVITDVLMPRLNGVGLFGELREWYPHIRFLLISGDQIAGERARGLAGEHTRFLAKPFGFDDLGAAVRSLLYEE